MQFQCAILRLAFLASVFKMSLVLWLLFDLTILVNALYDAAGHLKPFGSVGPFEPIASFDGFPSTSYFFHNYVLPGIPLKLTGAGRQSRAYELWTDEYFLSATMNSNSTVVVETAKKENRNHPVLHKHFQEFVHTYKTQDHYMVDRVPDEFLHDVLLPGPLQCPFVYEEMLAEVVMWMSGGGTSSVVHTDSYENIICVYDGRKNFVLIDPEKYGDNVDLDHPEGTYSDIDVDSVDYTKYPGLAEVRYHVVELQPGDCLYIPYKWIHQVRSFGRNLAVNIWWNHPLNHAVNLDQCPDTFDLNLTLDKVTFHGLMLLNNDVDSLRDQLIDILEFGIDVDEFIIRIVGNNDDVNSLDPASGYKLPLTQIFLIIDKNRDKVASVDEVDLLSEREWEVIFKQMERFEYLIEEASKKRSYSIKKNDLKNEL